VLRLFHPGDTLHITGFSKAVISIVYLEIAFPIKSTNREAIDFGDFLQIIFHYIMHFKQMLKIAIMVK
jgi:hypothetical protein